MEAVFTANFVTTAFMSTFAQNTLSPSAKVPSKPLAFALKRQLIELAIH